MVSGRGNNTLLLSMCATIVSGGGIYWLLRSEKIDSINHREGMAIVALGWIFVGLFGALERNIVELTRKIGIELPTFCYNSDLSIYGACRMCMVEDEKGRLMAACSTRPKNGMVIKTNMLRLRNYRSLILSVDRKSVV